jgi:hypothetical protein
MLPCAQRTFFFSTMSKHEADSLENVAKKLKQDMETDQKPGTTSGTMEETLPFQLKKPANSPT